MNDLIRRQAAIDVIRAFYDEFNDNEKSIEELISELPTIDPVKRGNWLPHPTEVDWNVCSVCGIGTHTRFHYNEGVYGGYDVEESFWYCPHCGARMDAERSE